MQDSLLSRGGRFVVVGGVGFLVDAAVLMLLVNVNGWNPFYARLLSFAVAVTATWLLNRRYTFARRRRHRTHAEYSRYVLAQSLGAALNYAVFAACLVGSQRLRELPVLALAVGSIVAMGFNFWVMQWLVFPDSGSR